MPIDQSIIDKIQKLINLKEGAEAVGSLHEAENAGARLQQFLMKYNLDLDEVKKSKIEAKAEMDKVGLDVSDMQDKRESNWVPELYKAVAENMLCYVIVSNTYIRVMGHKHNVQLVLYIAEQLVAKVRIAEKAAWTQYDGDEKRGTFRRGFLKGCGIGIRERLEQEKRNMQREKDNNPMALMIVNKEKELDEYLYELGYKTRPRTPEQEIEHLQYWEKVWAKEAEEERLRLEAMTPKELEKYKAQQARDEARNNKRWQKEYNKKGPKGLSSNDGYSAGKEAGARMDINKGLDEAKPKQHIS